MAKKVTTLSDLNTKSGKDVSEQGEFQAFSGRGESLSMQSATKEIAGDMAECSIGDNGNENGDEAKDKAAELSRTVKPVNKGDVSQSQSNSKTPVCSNQSTSRTTENVDWIQLRMSNNAQPTDGSIAQNVTVPSGNSQQQTEYPGEGIALGYQNQSPIEVDGGPADRNNIDWQFYLDSLARHLSEKLDDLATYLGIDNLRSIRNDYTTEHERCFHLLWTWRENCHQSGDNDDERLEVLRNALINVGLISLAEEPMKTRAMYEYTGTVCNGSTNVKDGIETLNVAKGIVNVHARFGRYFKLKEEIITCICANNSDSSQQAKKIISSCIQMELLRTRNDLCNGLNYVGITRLIGDMNKDWSK